jgi:hypothetical protein
MTALPYTSTRITTMSSSASSTTLKQQESPDEPRPILYSFASELCAVIFRSAARATPSSVVSLSYAFQCSLAVWILFDTPRLQTDSTPPPSQANPISFTPTSPTLTRIHCANQNAPTATFGLLFCLFAWCLLVFALQCWASRQPHQLLLTSRPHLLQSPRHALN